MVVHVRKEVLCTGAFCVHTGFSHAQDCPYEIFYTTLCTFNICGHIASIYPQGGFYVWVTLPEDTSAQGMYPSSGIK